MKETKEKEKKLQLMSVFLYNKSENFLFKSNPKKFSYILHCLCMIYAGA